MKRSHRRLAVIILVCLAASLVFLLTLFPRESLPPQIIISFIAYTNLPNSSRNYAIFTIANRDKTSIQVRDVSFEMEGEQGHRAVIFNRDFRPKIQNLLKSGDSQTMILGDPGDSDRPTRMRLYVEFSRAGLKQKLFMVGPRRPLLSLRPSGNPDELRLYLWRWRLPLTVSAPHDYSANSQWLPTPYTPQHVPAVTDKSPKGSTD